MPAVEVIGISEVHELLKTMPEHVYRQAKTEISRSVFDIQKDIVTPMRTGRLGLQSRTGNLARSIQFSISGTQLDTLQGKVFTKSIYAPIHETGGLISAKRAYTRLPGGPYLNIPAGANKTPAGIMRKTATTVFSQGGYIIPISAPRAKYAVMLNGTPMFWLVKSVNIRARLKMIETATDEVPTLLSNLNDVLLQNL